MIRALLSGALAVALFLPAPVDAKERASHLCSVAAFGDSITWGAYASYNRVTEFTSIKPALAHLVGEEDTSYPGELAHLLHVPVCNYGVPSELALHGLPRLRKLLQVVQPRIIVLLEGINDLASDRPAGDILRDLREMVRVARHHGVRPLLATLVPTYYPARHAKHFLNDLVPPFNYAVRQLAGHEHVTLADLAWAFRHDPRGGKLTVDYLHPNDAGYRLMARTVGAAIRGHRLLGRGKTGRAGKGKTHRGSFP